MGIENVGQSINDGIRDFAERIFGGGSDSTGATRPADGGWDASVGGKDAKPGFDRSMAKLAEAAYNPSQTNVDGWRRMGDGELHAAGIDASTQYRDGMLAGVYTDGNGHYAVAYAGNTGEDVPSVVAQSAGLDTKQMRNAVDLAHQVENAFGGDNVVFTGHSMGGSLAGAAAAATDSTSVVFNSQGVHDNTLSRLGLDPSATRTAMAERSRAYGVDGDWATHLQNDVPFTNALPNALGADLRIGNPEGISNLVNAHNMGPIVAAFDQGQPIRQGSEQPKILEQPLQNLYNTFTGFLRFLPITI